jgi:glycosyltransferase involved in cell wall biosynthesis
MLAVRKMEHLDIQHVHAHFGWSASTIALIANRLLGISFSLTLHSNEIYFDRLLLETKIRYARFIVTISEYNRQFLNMLFPDYKFGDKIHIIHCGLNPDSFAPSSEPRSGSNKLTIVGVGQLVPRKGFHILIESCYLIAKRNVDFRCYIYGEGEERRRLELLIDRYNLHEQVHMPGRVYQEELRQSLAKTDIFVLPCIKDKSGDLDGIPVALMEAMAMQIPTVSTTVSGIPELIKHGQNGLLTPPNDAVALADVVQQLKDNGELRQQLGRTGRETVINEFNIFKSAEQMAALFEQILLRAKM